MPLQVVMLGASGAVGHEVVESLCARSVGAKLTLLNWRPLSDVSGGVFDQHVVDVINPPTYKHLLRGAPVRYMHVGRRAAFCGERRRVRARR